jgi:hypothetical protein
MFLPASSFAEVLIQSEAGADVIRAEAAAAWPRAGPLGPTPTEAQWAQFSFENLPISDVLARTEHGIAQLEAVGEVLRLAAHAEEVYARALSDAAAPGRGLRGTGQGIGPSVDGGARASGLGQVAAAGLSALGGLFGAGAESAASTPRAGAEGGGVERLLTLGNGPGSLGAALEQMARSNAKLAAQRAALGAHFRRVAAGVQALRAAHRAAADAAAARIAEAVRATAGVARELERAQSRVDVARRALADAEGRYRSVAENPSAANEQEFARRSAALQRAK